MEVVKIPIDLRKPFIYCDFKGESRKILNTKEAYSIIVLAINKNIKEAEVCQPGCRMIWNIIERVTSQAIAKDSGIIEISAKAMRNHVNDEDICESCCSTLWKITNDRKYSSLFTYLF